MGLNQKPVWKIDQSDSNNAGQQLEFIKLGLTLEWQKPLQQRRL